MHRHVVDEVELKKALEEKVRADEIQARRIEMLDIAYNQLQVIFFINTKDVENSLESRCFTQTYKKSYYLNLKGI